LTLAAEVQHRLLPGSFTCEGGQFTLAAWLEPAGEVAGDTFDFAVERDVLHVSVTDAMGHGVEASVLATLLVGALRNARRAGAELAAQAALADEGLGRYVGSGGGFVTGQLARIDLRTGTASIVNAGHPAPLRLRDGRVESLVLPPDLPFGTLVSGGYTVHPVPLAQGDRLVFLTDGMIERNAASVDIRGLIVQSAGMHPREAVQDLTHAVLEAAGGQLQDDATVLCLDWHGGAADDVARQPTRTPAELHPGSTSPRDRDAMALRPSRRHGST
ncbi:MAG TPA: PP2C family protein-serine/threonine phosphatase, partial [Euzebyales bacterium]